MPSDHNPWTVPGGVPPRMGGGGGAGGGRGPGGPGGPRGPDLRDLGARLRGLLGAGGRGLTLLAVGVSAVWLGTGFFLVQPDELGLVMRLGAYNRTTPPGLNFHAPWPIEEALLLPVTRIHRVEIGFRSEDGDEVDPNPRTTAGQRENFRLGAERDLREESLMLTGDENIVDINASVFWRIRDADAFAFATRNPGLTVRAAAESVLRQVVGHTDIQSALTGGRAAIEQAVAAGAQKILDDYKVGVEITQVQLQKVDPPADVIEAFRDVQRANTDADRARNEAQSYANDIVPRARGEAAGITAAAEGQKQAAIAASTGEAQRFLSVYNAYSQARDITVKRLYIETMEEIFAHSDTTIVDDRLRGLLTSLALKPAGSAETSK